MSSFHKRQQSISIWKRSRQENIKITFIKGHSFKWKETTTTHLNERGGVLYLIKFAKLLPTWYGKLFCSFTIGLGILKPSTIVVIFVQETLSFHFWAFKIFNELKNRLDSNWRSGFIHKWCFKVWIGWSTKGRFHVSEAKVFKIFGYSFMFSDNLKSTISAKISQNRLKMEEISKKM